MTGRPHLVPLERLPDGACTRWKAPPLRGAHPSETVTASDSTPLNLSFDARWRRGGMHCRNRSPRSYGFAPESVLRALPPCLTLAPPTVTLSLNEPSAA